MRVEFFDHTGDIGLMLYAESLERLFAAAAEAFTRSICDPSFVEARCDKRVSLVAAAADLLLVDWLNELLYRFETERLLVRSARVAVTSASGQYQLVATLSGEPYDPARHRLKTLIKGVTYHRLSVTETPDGWQATVVLDV